MSLARFELGYEENQYRRLMEDIDERIGPRSLLKHFLTLTPNDSTNNNHELPGENFAEHDD
ncbi:MAG: hypothetical protein HC936_01300 [Leptolyngbyaceae cyanobacterium SU_3_3]|nr:hypothetical protein [Leptolyngbyaceae cyanobacterium SU_3_3]